jgi:rhodanese-related sulfurtransferase
MIMSMSIASSELMKKMAGKEEICLIDVRRKADFEKSPATIAGAVWKDPEKVAEWSQALPKDRDVVVYCVKGGSVSQSVANALRETHPAARFLEGGILGWEEKRE